MSHPQRGESTLELGARIAVIIHGRMAKEAQAIGIDDQGQTMLEKEAAKMLEVIPGRVRGDEDGP